MRVCRAGDIALLAPTGASLWRYERALEFRHVPVASQAGKGFFRRQEIQDLIALSRAIADRRDTLGFGALIRGPLVGLTEEEIADAIAALPAPEGGPPARLHQLCGIVVDPHPDSTRQLERALFHAVLDVTGDPRLDIFTHSGRVVLVRLRREARRLAENPGALAWLDAMSTATGEILRAAEYVDREQAGMFYASAQEMKANMRRQNVDVANLTIEDLGLFASPTQALRLSTIHYAKGREYDAVALIGLRKGTQRIGGRDPGLQCLGRAV
jgi:superfamily I DNA/RNA helicase